MRKPKIKLLDLCCKAGGAAMGYYKAANDLGLKIEITGIDIEPQPNYPFKFIKADAVKYLAKQGHKYTHYHASPPCQAHTKSTAEARSKGKVYPDIISELRFLIEKTNLSGVIENVPGAPVRPDIILRGNMFDLHVLRTRHFELVNWFMMQPFEPVKKGSVKAGDYCSVFGKGSYRKSNKDAIPKFQKDTVRETWSFAMGIDWPMTDTELAEAIPPAFTRYIGYELFKQYLTA